MAHGDVVLEGTLSFSEAGSPDVDFQLSCGSGSEYVSEIVVTNRPFFSAASGSPQLNPSEIVFQSSWTPAGGTITDDFDTAAGYAASHVLRLNPCKTYTLTITEN